MIPLVWRDLIDYLRDAVPDIRLEPLWFPNQPVQNDGAVGPGIYLRYWYLEPFLNVAYKPGEHQSTTELQTRDGHSFDWGNL